MSWALEDRGIEIPQSWSSKQLWASQHGRRELNLGPLEEQYVLLMAESSLQPMFSFLIRNYLLHSALDSIRALLYKQLIHHFGFFLVFRGADSSEFGASFIIECPVIWIYNCISSLI